MDTADKCDGKGFVEPLPSKAEMQNTNSILVRYLRCNLGFLTVEPLQFRLEVAKGSGEVSVLTFSDSDLVGASDRHRVSGTASWLHGDHSWYSVTVSSKPQSSIALSSGEAEAVAALSGACEGMGL